MFTSLYYAYEQATVRAGADDPLPSWGEISRYDGAYIEELNRKNLEDKTKLEVELKTYTSNMIKESIRVRRLGLDVNVSEANKDHGRWHIETLGNSFGR